MSKFTPRSEQTFLQRLFGGRKFSAPEVNFIQGEKANEYERTFASMQGEIANALALDNPPEEWLASGKTQEQWSDFKANNKSFKNFSASKYITMFGEDKLKEKMPVESGKKLFETFGDKETGQLKFYDKYNSPMYKDENGEQKTDVSVRTVAVDSEGNAKARTNNVTADGSNQRDSQDAGIAVDNSELDAMFEMFRRELQAQTGGRFSDNDDELEQYLIDEQLDLNETILSGDRGKVLDDTEKLAKFFKERGISIKDTDTGENFSTDDSVKSTDDSVKTAADQVSTDTMPNLEGTFSGAIVNPANPAVVKANEIITSYKRGDNVNVEELAGGLSKGFRQTFIRDFKSRQTQADAARTRIAELEKKSQENNGTLSKGDQQRLAGAKKLLEKSLDSQERFVEEVKTNIASDTKSYNERLSRNQDVLTADLDRVNFNLTVKSLSPEGRKKLITQQGNALKKLLTEKHLGTAGSDKTVVNQVLASTGVDLKAIQSNGPLMDDLKNLSGSELNAKYLKEDGSINEEAVYGKDFEPELVDVINRTVTKGQVAQLDKAIRDGNKERITELLSEVNLSEEDGQKLVEIFSKSPDGANYGKGAAKGPGGRGTARALRMIAMGTMNPESLAYKRLESPDFISVVESGRFSADALNYQAKQIMNATNQNQFDSMTDDFKADFTRYQTFLTDIEKDEDLTFETALPRINNFFNTMRNSARTNADLSSLLTQRVDAWARVTKNELQPGFWKEVFTLGFAKGPNENLLSEEIDIDVVTQNGGPPSPTNKIIGFRGGSGFKSSKAFEAKYGPDALEELARIAIVNDNKHISEAEANAKK